MLNTKTKQYSLSEHKKIVKTLGSRAVNKYIYTKRGKRNEHHLPDSLIKQLQYIKATLKNFLERWSFFQAGNETAEAYFVS